MLVSLHFSLGQTTFEHISKKEETVTFLKKHILDMKKAIAEGVGSDNSNFSL